MTKTNRTTPAESRAAAGPENSAALESKVPGRGKHGKQGRKKSAEELSERMSVRIFKRQQPASNEEIRAALDYFRGRPSQNENS